VRGKTLPLQVADVRNEKLRCQIAYRNPPETGRGVRTQREFVILQSLWPTLSCLNQYLEVVEKQFDEVA
jgi:hypothetical protein